MALKILHTADWHLGQQLGRKERVAGHKLALDWLLTVLVKEKIDVLIVAGDIFDVANPSNASEQLYFDFLKELSKTPVKHTLILGGNHDSVSKLNAPKELLNAFNVWVCANPAQDKSEDVKLLKDENDNPLCVLAAVPFLRDGDLKKGKQAESQDDRFALIQQGIKHHYAEIMAIAQEIRSRDCPIITTGHLFATGSTTNSKQTPIYVGNLENIAARDFPEGFDYVALGHIHKAQKVGKKEHIRYSGSLLPLSFGELHQPKTLHVVHFEKGILTNVESVEVPLFRKLIKIKGNIATILKELEALDPEKEALETWIAIDIEDERYTPHVSEQFAAVVSGKNATILMTKILNQGQYKSFDQDNFNSLDTYEPIEVFKQRLDQEGMDAKEKQKMETLFLEILNQKK